MQDAFRKLAVWISRGVGSFWAALVILIAALGTGYYFDFSESWQIKTSLSASLLGILILVFLQKSQNHSDTATHIKLDEIIRAVQGAHDEVMSIEEEAESRMENIREKHRAKDISR